MPARKSDEDAAGLDQAGRHSVRLSWDAADQLPVVVANQLLVQIDFASGVPDTAVLTVGYAAPPIVLGTVDEQKQKLELISDVPVNPLIRISLTRRRLQEWSDLIGQTLAKIDEFPATEDDGDD